MTDPVLTRAEEEVADALANFEAARARWVAKKCPYPPHPNNHGYARQYRNATHEYARMFFRRAFARGLIAKPSSCSECGKDNLQGVELHAHHSDYDRPLDVEWLCRQCHGGRPR